MKKPKGSKGAKAEPPPPAELTPKQQKEQRREEARKRAAETRKIVTAGIGQWTGKLPAQLLNEHAQSMRWERVEYPLKPVSKDAENPSWTAIVVLARKHPKTKAVEHVRLVPPKDKVPPQPTQVEARHLAATYGLHRVLSHRNLKPMLPPFHRDLWIALDADKSSANPETAKYTWNEDPWQAEIDKAAAQERRKVEQAARSQRREQNELVAEANRAHTEPAKSDKHKSDGSKSDKGKSDKGKLDTGKLDTGKSDKAESKSEGKAQGKSETKSEGKGEPKSAPKKVRFNNTLVMSRKTRAVIEKVIRANHGFRFSEAEGLRAAEFPAQHAKLTAMLEKLGWAPPFVAEALDYASTLSGALTWLLIHVPEEDVPRSFMPTHIGVTARVSASVAVENAAARLRALGYSEELSRSAAEEAGGSLRQAVVALTRAFLPATAEAGSTADSATADSGTDDSAFWEEEVESIKAIIDGCEADADHCVLTSTSAKFRLSVFRSPGYPETVPGIAVEGLGKVSKVAQLEATRRAALYTDAELKGDYTILALFQHLEETFAAIVAAPTRLTRIATGIIGVNEDSAREQAQQAQQQRRTRRRGAARKFDAAAVAREQATRMVSAKGRGMLAAREALPAWQKRQEIAELVAKHPVCLITGETGSGKSTQTVQFVLDAMGDAQIVCTQPRRISAIGVAQRVADERLVDIGAQVGYVIRGENKVGPQTQIRFVTTGILLRMLQGSAGQIDGDDSSSSSAASAATPDLDGLTHIFVDEVHERSLDSDFLLILLKRLVEQRSPVKIVLMSATVDPKQFIDYFKPASVGYTHISGRTFPVTQYYLGDIVAKTKYQPPQRKPRRGRGRHGPDDDDDDDDDDDGPGGKDDADINIGKVIGAIRLSAAGRVDYELVAATVAYIHRRLGEQGDNAGSILVFLSGAEEIDRTLRAIKASSVGSQLWALPLHASLPPAEQRKVFARAPGGLRKVIASTNVAETSITIADIVAVVDSGRVKETVYDAAANVSRLVDVWTSRAAATQRQGRAGRVRAGECYKLYTENAEAQHMPARPVPEILRAPLEVLYLHVKAMGVADVERFLARAIDPPEAPSLDAARQNLVAYGALDARHLELTPLGRHIATIPTDPRTAKLLVLGALVGCLPRALTVAAIASLGKLPFRTERDNPEHNAAVFAEFGGIDGDLLAGARAYELWDQGVPSARALVSPGVCRDVRAARRQLLSSLVQIGLVAGSGGEAAYARFNASDALVRAVIGAALQPQTVELVFPQQKFVATATGSVEVDGVDDSRQIRLFASTGERVFLHPRSLLFGRTRMADDAHYLAFSTAVMTSKHFIAENTPLSVYGLALFAPRIGVDPLGNGVVVDRWTGLKCWPRAGILLQFLQQLLGDIMERKFRDPGLDLAHNPVIQLVHDLLESEGKPAGVGMVE